MNSSNRLLSALGLDQNAFFFSNTLILYYKNQCKPFGYITLKDGKSLLHVGEDVPATGHSVILNS